MNYGELIRAILDESLRPDLVDAVPGFVARAEGMIARDLRASEMIAIGPLLETSRTAAGSALYVLPTGFLEDRAIYLSGRALRKTSRAGFRQTPAGTPVAYAIGADITLGNLVEFNVAPGTDAPIELEYFTRLAALVEPTDTNRLLLNHESIYIDAALFSLYKYTQDSDLAQAALDTWSNAKNTLNEQAGRFLAGTNAAPKYNLGRFSPGGSR